MRVNKIRAVGGYRTRHRSASKPSELVPNVLLRNFDVASPNKAWVTDITYVRTWQGWLYLAVVMDLFSRMIIGWATRPTIGRELVLDAILIAVRTTAYGIGARIPVMCRAADRSLVRKLNRQLKRYGHAEFKTNAAAYGSAHAS